MQSSSMQRSKFRNVAHGIECGLTLVEMLVVLTIMAALAGVAVQMTSQRLDQGRVEATLRTLENIEAAIIGPRSNTPSTDAGSTASFVADMGQLPTGVDSNINLGLLLLPTDLPPQAAFDIRAADAPHTQVRFGLSQIQDERL